METSTTNNHLSTNKFPKIDNPAGFTIDTYTIQTLTEATKNLTNGVKSLKNISPLAASTPMTTGRTYRILIYKNNSPELWQTIHATVGQPVNIDVSKGDTYKWFAYSYNNTETLPIPSDTQNPTVPAPVDKDLLYASDQLVIPMTPPGQNNIYNINITFNHKMAQIKVKIDGTLLAKYATINGLKATFSQNNYIKSGTFDIKNNSMGNYTTVPTTEILNTASNPTNIWEATYYTADASSLTSYNVKITHLPVTFKAVAPSIADVNLATFTNSITPLANIERTFTFTNPQSGQILLAEFVLSYTFPSRRILHVSCDCIYGYSMERGGGWAVINDTRNFGNLPESLVRMQPYATGQGVWKGGNATNAGTANAANSNYLTTRASVVNQQEIIDRLQSTNINIQPDIVVFGHDMYYMLTALNNALVEYVNKGGVFIMMNELNAIYPKEFLYKLFGVSESSITMTSLGGPGAMYKILNVDDPVTNGPFGDVRGKHWGEDASVTVGVNGLPANDIIVYSYGLPVNHNVTGYTAWATIPSMFRHKTKNFFYLGDGGLTSFLDNTNTSYTTVPFKYDPATRRPLPKPYGYAWINTPDGVDYPLGSQSAYNGHIAGNIMLWSAELAEFKGIKPWRYDRTK
ncbi:fimbrillin family protein [Sphingobacterium bovistauri]|uniref:Fimbrillin family protein n=1 Tax=Sphingobacterium bovistauri TaxID=2781959 RepID=A0ABS7Z2R9_9SPHI|nr:fimbrillin family protein [Sphingobacterium bovistauri]MCA5004430.1 fimbrillin family protein [Sphingobacterium bovistauri]